jgi:putative hydrolase of the HAD superfamily
MRPRIDLLVLDAHGVVLNAYWPRFLHEVARLTHEPVEEVLRRWHDRVRTDAWLGRINDDELWKRLIPAHYGRRDWQAILEAGYTRGPAEPHLRRWSACVPVWLLSNHRTHWLLPRLKRFGVLEYFERILVSDTVGAAKPERNAFQVLLGQNSHAKRLLFVDDQACNVETARQLGLGSLHAQADGSWVAAVYNSLGASLDTIGVSPERHVC